MERVLSMSRPFSLKSISDRVKAAKRTPQMTLLRLEGFNVPCSEYMPRTIVADVALAQKKVHTRTSITTERIFPRGYWDRTVNSAVDAD